MLPYTEEVLISLFSRYNEAIWPVQLLFLGLAIVTVVLVLRPRGQGSRAIGLVLAVGWAWVGIALFFFHFAPLDFSAPIYGSIFLVQALLLLVTISIRGKVTFRFSRNDFFSWAGLTFLFAALAGFPLLDWVMGFGLQSLRVFGAAPGATMLFTIGLLLLTDCRSPLHLAFIPFVWVLQTGVTAFWLHMPQDMALAVAAGLGISLIVIKNRPRVSFIAPEVEGEPVSHLRQGTEEKTSSPQEKQGPCE